ncbi:conserved hypothetical protein [Streptomyces viridochromogenes DSM 40736]|uniref:ABC transporter ATP-binding protein n=1 Tax=Streptomyces viridochromogenes (strain DSM 40736 / JCM 4977 / BCRC 1201 / Tue 494) TaxID=591159 RepID=D9XHH3_STRVT|nr:conserved hypothetical protein [Streptomyces viridochromogenes DSM 40736]
MLVTMVNLRGGWVIPASGQVRKPGPARPGAADRGAGGAAPGPSAPGDGPGHPPPGGAAAAHQHALLLREGRPLAAGPAAEVLTADHLGKCFDLPPALERHDGRWSVRTARRA